MGEKETTPLSFTFNGCLKVAFQGSRVTSDTDLILVRALDERLGLEAIITEHLRDSRQGLHTHATGCWLGHYMITDQERRNTLGVLGQSVLDALQTLASNAADKLNPQNEPTTVLALLDNPMTEQRQRLRSIERSLAADRQYLARLTREPFVKWA